LFPSILGIQIYKFYYRLLINELTGGNIFVDNFLFKNPLQIPVR